MLSVLDILIESVDGMEINNKKEKAIREVSSLKKKILCRKLMLSVKFFCSLEDCDITTFLS